MRGSVEREGRAVCDESGSRKLDWEIIMSKFLKLVLALSMVGFIAGCDKSMSGSMSADKSMSKN